MVKTASAKPLLYPVAHLDDLGQRSKHALVGHELCLGALKLHGDGGRGGTAPAAVAVQLERAEAQLVADEGVFGSLTKVVEMGHGVK